MQLGKLLDRSIEGLTTQKKFLIDMQHRSAEAEKLPISRAIRSQPDHYDLKRDVFMLENLVISSYDSFRKDLGSDELRGLYRRSATRAEARENLEAIAGFIDKRPKTFTSPLLKDERSWKPFAYVAIGKTHGLKMYPVVAGDEILVRHVFGGDDYVNWNVFTEKTETDAALMKRKGIEDIAGSTVYMDTLYEKEQPGLFDYLISRGLNSDGKYAEALKFTDSGIKAIPDMPGLLYERSRALHGLGRYDDALDASRKVYDLNPHDIRGFMSMSGSYMGLSGIDKKKETAAE